MGYACPVCETPQADGGHLANHLAFTALLHGDAHEDWLDEHVPGWHEEGEDELAGRAVEHAEEVAFPQVFEDTTEHTHARSDERVRERGENRENPRERSRPIDRDDRSIGGGHGSAGELDPTAARIVEEAREMTRRMLDDPDTAAERSERAAESEPDDQ